MFVEVGPCTLTSFASDTLRAHDDVVAVATNSRRRHGVTQLHHALAQFTPPASPNRRRRTRIATRAIADPTARRAAGRRGITTSLQMLMSLGRLGTRRQLQATPAAPLPPPIRRIPKSCR